MKKLLIPTVLFFTLIFSEANAQYVTISDPGMVSWLTTNFPSAMNGNAMDTTNSSIVNAVTISGSSSTPISNLDGIQYFDNAWELNFGACGIYTIPALPPNLGLINLTNNNITSLPPLPNGLQFLNCQFNILTSLPSLPNTLTSLYCGANNLTSLPSLPNSVYNLNCWQNNLTSLPTLPTALLSLDCMDNDLTNLPSLPSLMTILNCGQNNLTSLPALPASLTTLFCHTNSLTSLPTLANSLTLIDCSDNILTSLPALPQSLGSLNCIDNDITSLPILPNSLYELYCESNDLTALPNLPPSLGVLVCGYNNLSTLPTLPNSLVTLSCVNDNITSIPALPSSVGVLLLYDNPGLSCLPVLPDGLTNLIIASTDISCLPNFPVNLNVDVAGLPICLPGNTNGCLTTGSISGAIFDNSLGNCVNTANLTTYTTFQLFDGQNNFLQSSSSAIDDQYYFSVQPGSYVVQVDSSFLPSSVSVDCPISGEHLVTAVLDSAYLDRDFSFQCVGADLGVVAIVEEGIVFPGQPHSVKAIVGDLSNAVGLNCAVGVSGTVQLTVSGPVTFTGFPVTALAPNVNGTTYSYTVSDFASTSMNESFVLDFLTDTTAQLGDWITVTVSISPTLADLDSSNHVLTYTYQVVNSYDPNMKVVNPVNVLPGYDDYFTYTVHFQNLGTAPAFNIKIKDVLDVNLDFPTFRVINSSHVFTYNLFGDMLTVYFPNIMLADSASNPEGSKGFIQYQVKPKPNLPHGTNIQNTADIFFDFNPAVVTNTTINAFLENLSITEESGQMLTIYPNPSAGDITLVNQQNGNEAVNIRIYDLLGKELHSESVNFTSGVAHLNLNVNAGTYMLVVENEMGALSSSRLVIQK